MHFGARHAHIDELSVDGFRGAGDGAGVALVLGGHVVERAMRLHMAKRLTGIGGESLQRADLVSDHVFKVARVHVHGPPPEPPQIIEARMRAKADAMFLRQGRELLHDRRVAAMEAAGDIGRGYDMEQFLIAPNAISTVTFAHIRVEIDPHSPSYSA